MENRIVLPEASKKIIADTKLYVGPEKMLEYKYNLELNKERIARYIRGLDSSIKIIAAQLQQSNNSALALRNLLPELIKLDEELQFLDSIIDQVEENKKPNNKI